MIPAIVIIGPTCTGKTSLGISLALSFGGEIINGDSMQIYRGMDIGTAKPSAEELSAVPHHLIDLLDFSDPFSDADFCGAAQSEARDLHSRSKIPVIVGGTGMYIETLLSGRLYKTQSADPKRREDYYAVASGSGAAALHAMLAERDPESAAKIHPNNVKRVVRALEMCDSGTPKSALERDTVSDPPFDPLVLLLLPDSREELYSHIDDRVDGMISSGLESEVRSLCERGLRTAPTASQAIGYKEFFPVFDGLCGIPEAVEQIKRHTRNYAKRQLTYFGHMKQAVPVTAGAGAVDSARRIYCQWSKTR